MKKVLVLLLVLTLAFSAVACGGDTTSEEAPATTEEKAEETTTEEKAEETKLVPEQGATLKVWESPGPEGEYVQKVAEAFKEKYSDYDIEITYEEVPHTDATGRLTQDGPAGVGADVFAAPHDQLGELVAAGLIYPNSLTADRVNTEYLDAAKVGVSFDGKVYGYPLAIETYGLFYNKDIYETAPKSYEEIIEFAGTYNNPDENKYAIMFDVGNAYFSHSFIAGKGGYVFGSGGTDKNELGLNTDGGVQGLTEMVELKEILPLAAGDTTYAVMDGLFQEGKAGAIINGPWAVQNYIDAGLNFGIAPLPTMSEGDHPQSFSGIRSLFVSSYTEYPQAAQLFAEFASSDEMLLERFNATKQIPPVKALMDEEAIAGNEYVAPFLEQAQYATPMPSISEMGSVWDPYAAAFSSAWNGDQTPKEALDQAVDTISTAIESQE